MSYPYWLPGALGLVALCGYIFTSFGLYPFLGFCVISLFLILFLGEESVVHLFAKIDLFATGFVTFILSKDKSMKKERLFKFDPANINITDDLPTKQFVFIRHAESEWNAIFNKSKLLLLPRLILGILREALMFLTRDSLFVDASLSQEGIDQVHELTSFLDKEPDVAADPLVSVLRGDTGVSSSVIVSSNLRRAIATCTLGLRRRLRRTQEKVLIHSSLQEISRNVDANAISGEGDVPDLHRVMSKNLEGRYDPASMYDVTHNHGNKPISTNGLARTEKFLEWAFDRSEGTIIVGGGHSLWFRNFFKIFLPRNTKHHAGVRKMKNCGVVALKVTQARHEGKPVYIVHDESIKPIYLGFH